MTFLVCPELGWQTEEAAWAAREGRTHATWSWGRTNAQLRVVLLEGRPDWTVPHLLSGRWERQRPENVILQLGQRKCVLNEMLMLECCCKKNGNVHNSSWKEDSSSMYSCIHLYTCTENKEQCHWETSKPHSWAHAFVLPLFCFLFLVVVFSRYWVKTAFRLWFWSFH